ncbi:hypothetical protein GGS23DRAFT_614578 [Durotheca rogersii]|uniref:uncharacterized protein n=1 Tax=Durotheca rogersii TaxID=419775 RepID=UPI0022210090|nr:uncharacterized protein GGS23DRAFT_614578 [Durotheca rogersii]KAI5859776.1 hypothetical protein GGS23DRAFT_614578 [Durotheca rogersii]
MTPSPAPRVLGIVLSTAAPLDTSLVASVVRTGRVIDGNVDIYPVVRYVVDCPAENPPENDACRALSIYPADAHHIQGSVYGGAITTRGLGQTMTWMCALGDCRDCAARGAKMASCAIDGVDAESVSVTRNLLVQSCDQARLSVPLVVTAGVEKLDPNAFKATLGVSDYLSAWQDDLASMDCAPAPALSDYAAQFQTTTAPAADATSTGAPATGSTPSTDRPASTTEPGNDAAKPEGGVSYSPVPVSDSIG